MALATTDALNTKTECSLQHLNSCQVMMEFLMNYRSMVNDN